MDREEPGDLGGEMNEIAPQLGSGRLPATPPAQSAGGPEPSPTSERHGFTLQPGGGIVRSPIADTAERIGSTIGAAQQQLRQGLELVHPGPEREEPGVGQLEKNNREFRSEPAEDNFAARMMHAIEEEVARIRREFTGGLTSVPCPDEARLQQLRGRLRDALQRIRRRASQLVAENPMQAAAALAGLCLAFGAALCLRRSHRF